MFTYTQNATTRNAEVAEPWRQLWNGDVSITDRILAEDFVAHAAPITGVGDGELHGRQALNR